MELAQKSVKKVRGRPFVKGDPRACKNPSGRPRNLVCKEYIVQQTDNLREIDDFYMAVFRGEIPGANVRDRMTAAQALDYRVRGKPIETQLQGNLNEGDTYTLLHGHQAPKPPEADGKP